MWVLPADGGKYTQKKKVASQHKDKEHVSSDVRLVAQPKHQKKKKKTPSGVAQGVLNSNQTRQAAQC